MNQKDLYNEKAQYMIEEVLELSRKINADSPDYVRLEDHLSNLAIELESIKKTVEARIRELKEKEGNYPFIEG